MRRSTRTLQKRQNRLPVELQLAILREASIQLELEAKGKKRLSELCLVSRDWRIEGQRLLYRSIAHSRRKISVLIRNKPRIAAVIEEIDMRYVSFRDTDELAAIFAQGSRLPMLKSLKNIVWTSKVAASLPAPLPVPALRSLSIQYRPALSYGLSAPLVPHFDLSVLQAFERSYCHGSDFGPADLAELPSTITRLDLRNFSPTKLGPVLQAIGRFVDTLTDLTLLPQYNNWTGTSSLVLPVLPRLRCLAINHHQNPGVFITAQPALTNLGLSWAEYETQPASDVAHLCNIIRNHPGRFPALKNVVYHDMYGGRRRFSAFVPLAPDCSVYERRIAALFSRRATALREAGLAFVDELGVAWREEWDTEEPAAEASV